MPDLAYYWVGGTMQEDNTTYVERAADVELLSLCRQGAYAYVLSSRQVGKSSLMVRTAAKLAGDGVRTARVDLTAIGRTIDAEQWYVGLLSAIADELGPQIDVVAWWRSQSHLPETQRFTTFFKKVVLAQAVAPVVIFVDEIEVTINLAFRDDFFAAIRYFFNARATDEDFRRLTVVLIGCATPSDLARDPQRTPFNIGQRVDLADFSEEEMAPLAGGLDLPAEQAHEIVRWVHGWTGGHPYLTQRLFAELAQRQRAVWRKEDVDAVVADVFLNGRGEADSNLSRAAEMLTRGAADPCAVLTTYQQILRGRPPVHDDEQSPIKAQLKLSGVALRGDQGLLVLRNRIYAECFNEGWVQGQLQAIEKFAPELGEALCPYVGLDAFKPEQHQLFFGREAFVQTLIERLKGERSLGVVGPAGSGKSSLVLAGLLPALQAGALPGSQEWRYYPPIMPGSDPLAHLAWLPEEDTTDILQQIECFKQDATGLAALVGDEKPAILIVDQLEELFTLCADDTVRRAFVANLLELSRADVGHRVVLAMRTGFEPHLALLPGLRELLGANPLPVVPLDPAQLRRAVEEPAALVGLRFEEGVVDALVRDIAGEPAGLPLLQFTLRKLWELRERNRVTWAAYYRLGGPRQALARSADEFFDGLILEEQITARRVLLRLAGGGGMAGPPRVRRAMLYRANEAQEQVDRALEKLCAAQLVRLIPGDSPYDDQVQLAHEALATNWPRLVTWLDGERESLRERERLTAAAEEWARSGRDPDALLRGARIDDALRQEGLSELEVEFVQASVDNRAREEQEEEARRERELATERQLREQAEAREASLRRALLMTRLLIVLGAILVAFTAASGWYYMKTTQEQARRGREARARELAMSAQSRLSVDPAGSLRDAIEAVKVTYGVDGIAIPEAEEALQDTAQNALAWRILEGHSEAVNDVDYSPDWRYVATASSDGTIGVWDVITRTRVLSLTLPGAVYAVAYSPAGTRLAGAGADGTVRVWDARSGVELQTLAGHTGAVNQVTFSPDGKRLATAGADATARVWDAATGMELLRLSGHTNAVRHIAFSPDGRTLATASGDGTTRMWDLDTGEQKAVFRDPSNWVNAVAFSPDGGLLATASISSTVSIWDTVSGAKVKAMRAPGDASWVRDVAFSPDGRRLATASADGPVREWSVASAQVIRILRGHSLATLAIAYSPDGQYLATASADKTARIWQTSGLQPILALAGHTGPIRDLAYSPDGDLLASAGEDGTVRVWNLLGGSEWLKLVGHTGAVRSAAFSPDGRQVVTASSDGTARLWDAMTGTELRRFTGLADDLYSAAFAPDGRTVVTAGGNRYADIFDIATGTTLYSVVAANDGLRSASFSPDGRTVVIASADRTARLWDLANYDPDDITTFSNLTGHTGDVNSAVFSADGRTVVTASSDHTARLWNADSHAELRQLTGHTDRVNSAAFGPNGLYVVTASDDGTARVWDAISGQELGKVTHESGPINSVAFSPDGRYGITAGDDGTARLWDATTGGQLQQLVGHSGPVNSAVFSPNGRYVVTASDDGTARLWDLAPGAEVLTLKGDSPVWAVAFGLSCPGGVQGEQKDATGTPGEQCSLRLATGDAGGKVTMWDARTGKRLFALEGHSDKVYHITFSPDGTRLATASADGTARLWDATTGQPVGDAIAHGDEVQDVVFNADGTLLATACKDGTVRVWEVGPKGIMLTPRYEHRDLNSLYRVSFDPKGNRLAEAGAGTVALIRVLGEAQAVGGLQSHEDAVYGVAFDPVDGKRLATASGDKTVGLWDTETLAPLFTLLGADGKVYDVTYSPDGRRLAAAGEDGVARIYTLDISELLSAAQQWPPEPQP